MSSCSTRSLEDTHLLTITSCWEKINGQWSVFSAQWASHSGPVLPGPLVCSDTQVSRAHRLTGRPGRWCNTAAAPVSKHSKIPWPLRVWLSWGAVTPPGYLGNVGCDPAQSCKRTPWKRTQPRASVGMTDPLHHHRITGGQDQSDSQPECVSGSGYGAGAWILSVKVLRQTEVQMCVCVCYLAW